MAVQQKILKTAPFGLNGTYEYTDAEGVKHTVTKPSSSSDTDKSLYGTSGTLAIGVPGNLYDATPARITTGVLTAEADIGSFVTGKGVIVNTREYASVGTSGNPLGATLTLPTGTTVSFCTFGHVIVRGDKVSAITDAMNAKVIVGTVPDTNKDKSVVVVEINGFAS